MSADAVLLTGATGFLGRELARRLCARGERVEALARRGSDRSGVARLPIAWHEGDLADADADERAVAAFRARTRERGEGARVLHCGALISYRTRDRGAAVAANVEGTRNVLASARRHEVDRLLLVSSVVAVGTSPDGRPVDEGAAFDGAGLGVDYVDTKRAAEELVLAERGSLDVVAVNPGAIFGPVERASNTARFVRRVAEGRSPWFAPPGTVSVVGLDDAAEGTLLALDRGRRGERYLLVESSLTALELFRAIARAVGARPARWRVPRALWPAVVLAARVVDRVRPLELTPPQALVMLGCDLRFDARKAREELGWRPRPFDEVLAATVEGLRERGLL